jgi:hypothetical protein
MAERTPHTPHLNNRRDWAPAFLAALAASPNVSAAASAAGIDRKTAYNRQKSDPDFAVAWDDALDQSTDNLVGEAYRRATRGTENPVFYQGAECGHVREYSDTLAIFLLKSHRPAVYRETVEQQHSGGLRVEVVYADRPPDLAPAAPGAGPDPGGDEEV